VEVAEVAVVALTAPAVALTPEKTPRPPPLPIDELLSSISVKELRLALAPLLSHAPKESSARVAAASTRQSAVVVVRPGIVTDVEAVASTSPALASITSPVAMAPLKRRTTA
jgi:hypothetical protein